jgi:hypothetical protein
MTEHTWRLGHRLTGTYWTPLCEYYCFACKIPQMIFNCAPDSLEYSCEGRLANQVACALEGAPVRNYKWIDAE